MLLWHILQSQAGEKFVASHEGDHLQKLQALQRVMEAPRFSFTALAKAAPSDEELRALRSSFARLFLGRLPIDPFYRIVRELTDTPDEKIVARLREWKRTVFDAREPQQASQQRQSSSSTQKR
jgi:hypothetical protein